MTETEVDGLRRELSTQCNLRHAEDARRLDNLEQQQRDGMEAVFGKVNRIAEQQAGLAVKVDTAVATSSRVETKLDAMKEATAKENKEEQGRRGGAMFTVVLAISGWAIALLLFILKELMQK